MSAIEPSPVSIGCQQGGPEGGYIGDLKVPLWQALCRHVTSTHCSTIDQYALVLRVDGALDKFGEEGIAHIRFAKARRYITLDIQIPEAVWRPLNSSQTKLYLASVVRAALSACVARLRLSKISVGEASLNREVEAGIAEYLSASNSD